jgi:hypothetical protein
LASSPQPRQRLEPAEHVVDDGREHLKRPGHVSIHFSFHLLSTSGSGKPQAALSNLGGPLLSFHRAEVEAVSGIHSLVGFAIPLRRICHEFQRLESSRELKIPR